MLQAEEDLLVMTAQSGNHKAFNALVIAYQKPLLRFAYKLGNDHELANDAVQDCWIKISKNLYQLKDPRAFKSWIYRMVKWRTTDLLRVKNNDKTISEDKFIEEAIVDNSSQKNNQSELSSAINRLPEIEKQMIHLFYLDEMKLTEISLILDIPVGTVKSRLNRARKLLQHKLKQKFDCS